MSQRAPDVQHRGGPQGFLKVLDGRTIAFAEYAGNKQYISIGHLAANERSFLFLMDYTNARRLKLWRAGIINATAGFHRGPRERGGFTDCTACAALRSRTVACRSKS
jgi:predicted pyridoxine 5'-phosphate oxidase superfamily flavin-nucleotide-binding protein